MLKRPYVRFLALSAWCLSLSAAAWSSENACIDCHQDSSFFAQYPKLHEYYQQWLSSTHRQAGLGCEDCHGGDSSAATRKAAHRGVYPMNDESSTLHYQAQPDTCGQCHNDKQQQFVRSKHYAALMDDAHAAPTCTTCHPAMSRRPELRNIVLDACRNCHGEGNPDGLPLIADQAEDVFKHLNIAAGMLGWTRIHYESHGWPDDSKNRVSELENRYQTTVNKVHQFDLQQTDDSTVAILIELREIFDAARRANDP
jgi:hypothetical protein